MAKAIKLNIKNNFDFLLIGLVTSEPIYRLSWLLNQVLGTHLADTKSIQLIHKQTKVVQVFTRFEYNDESDVCFELIQNKSANGFFIEEQKNIDYFLKVSELNLDKVDLMNQIKDIKNISLAILVEPGSLKSKDRLISYVIEEE